MKKFPFSALTIIGMIVGTTIIRTFLENISNPEPIGGFTSVSLVINYSLYYALIVVSIGIILGLILRESWMKHISRAAYFLPVIWVAPIVDFMISGGACMAYIGTTGTQLVRDYLTFFGPLPKFCGITIGMRIEIVLVLIGIGWYVWKKTSSFWKSLVGLIAIYSAVFIQLSLPGIVRTFGNTTIGINEFFQQLFSQSLLGTIHSFSYGAGMARFVEQLAFFSGRIPWIALAILVPLAIWHDYPAQFFAWIKNGRYVRIAYYVILAIAGVVMACAHFSVPLPLAWLDIVSYGIFGISLCASFWLAVAINDIEDESIDRISNADRPLINGSLSKSDLQSIAVIAGAFIITGGLLINWNVFMMLVVFQTAYAIYSLPPYRLKSHYAASSFLVGCAGISAMLAGYFLVAPDPGFAQIPYAAIFFTFVAIAIISNAKDFKDVAGDRAEGVQTMPARYGSRRAAIYMVSAFVIWILIAGWYFHSIWIAVQAVPWVLMVVAKKRIPEYAWFLLLFAQMTMLLIVL